MKNLKRVACLVLALALVCSLGLTALAASEDPYTSATADTRGAQFPDVTSANNEEAIYALRALGVFAGYPDGKFYPGNNMTRAEFAKIVYFFCGNDAADLTYFESLKSQFKDIYEGNWAEGYINFCAIEGYFLGYSDGTFRAGNNVTMQEAATVLLRTLGYTDALKGTWPNDYNRKAVDIGLTEYVNYIGGSIATRDQLAQMAYNVLDCYKVVYIADQNAASIGYLAGGAAAMLGTLYNELLKNLGQQAGTDSYVQALLKYINMYAVDSEGFAYMYGKTNEGNSVYYDLLAAAFGATKQSVHFATPDFYDYLDIHHQFVNVKDFGVDMIESCGWHVASAAIGSLNLDFYASFIPETKVWNMGVTVPLASTYYLVGGDLTDLGDTEGRVIISARGEAIFAATDGRDGVVWDINSRYIPMYTNNPGPANDYYDLYAEADFGIFKSVSEDRLGYTTFSYWTEVNNAPAAPSVNAVTQSSMRVNVESIVGKTAELVPAYRFYNKTIGKFISYTELVPGDLLYDAGFVGAAKLILVYNASRGNLTEVTNWIPSAQAYAKISGTTYTYKADGTEEAFLSTNGGFSYDYMTYEAFSSFPVLTTKEVAFAPAYRNTQLAYLAANITAPFTYPVGVVTGYTYGTDYKLDHDHDLYYVVRSYTGVTLFTEAGQTVTYPFAAPFTDADFQAGTLGDLITLKVNSDGKVVNTDSAFTAPPIFEDYAPEHQHHSSITTDAVNGRINIHSWKEPYHDIYTLAPDAVIFMLSSGATGGFASVKLMTTAQFLATAEYQFTQVYIYKSLPNNNTITGLYVVNCVAADQTLMGVAVHAGIADGKYILTMLDGTTYQLRDTNDQELFEARVPSFISYKVNADGKLFDVDRIIHQYGDDTYVNFHDFYEVFDGHTNYRITLGTFDSIFTNSVITTENEHHPSMTLFLNDDIVYFNFVTGAPCSITNIVSTSESLHNGIPASELAYVYNTATQELAYIFVISPDEVELD